MMPESNPALVIDQTLDARGWLCPRPVIEARQMLQAMRAGDVLEVLLTDAHGPLDFQVLCQRNGYALHAIEELADADEEATLWRILLSRKAVSRLNAGLKPG